MAATDRANGYSYVQSLTMTSSSTTTSNPTETLDPAKTIVEGQKKKKSELRDYYYQFASDQLESSVMMALEIQEKYGSS